MLAVGCHTVRECYCQCEHSHAASTAQLGEKCLQQAVHKPLTFCVRITTHQITALPLSGGMICACWHERASGAHVGQLL